MPALILAWRNNAYVRRLLKLKIHPKKIIIRQLSQGIDFLGYIIFLRYRLLRKTTKRRMLSRLKQQETAFILGQKTAREMDQCLQSYLGILRHCNQLSLSLSLSIHNAYGVRLGTSYTYTRKGSPMLR